MTLSPVWTALLGAGAGTGALCLAAGTRRRRESLLAVVVKYEGVPGHPTATAARDGSPGARLASLGRAYVRLFQAVGRGFAAPQDLAIVERDPDSHLVAVGAAALLSALAGALAGTGLTLLGVHPGLAGPLLGILSGAVAGAALPGVSVKRAAARARGRFLRALGCWLDLVAMAQAGGMGVESALHSSSAISNDPPFRRLANVLERSRLGSGSPWEGLGRLGREIGLPALEELASTLSLAGTEGARVRTSLIAKSASIRRRQLAAAEAEANATTERLFLPSVVLMVAFMLFLLYPAAVGLLGAA